MQTTLPQGRIMGFDYGLKRIGIALANPEIAHAQPLTTIVSRNHTPNWDKIADLVDTWQPVQFVVGRTDTTPLNLQIKHFARELKKRYTCPVDFIEEDYTSTEASAMLKALRQDGRVKKVKKEEIDKWAAALILETWLSKQGLMP